MSQLAVIQKAFAPLRGTTFAQLHGDDAQLHFAQEWAYFEQLMQNPKTYASLINCTPESVVDSIKTVVVLGLSLNPIKKQAYLIAYKQKDAPKSVCTARISYRGEIDYLARQGVIERAVMGTVYSNDKFTLEQGDTGTKYRYIKAHGDRGQFIGAFCVFHLPGGGTHGDFLPLVDIKKRAAKSAAKGESGTFWRDYFDEMAMKTAAHYAFRGLPSNPAIQKLQEIEQPHMLAESAQVVELDDDRVKQIHAMFSNAENVQELNELFGNFDASEKAAKRAQEAYMFHKGRIAAERLAQQKALQP